MPSLQPPVVPLPESSGDYVGAVSHLISAALQTAGLYFQQQVLVEFEGLLSSLGVLLFLLAVIGALVLVAVFGEYKKAAYVLLGPVLFWLVIGTVTSAKPTLLRVGERVEAEGAKQQLEILKLMGDGDTFEKQFEVSWLFAKLDNLVSSVVQSLVSFLVDTENKRDIVVVAREEVHRQLTASRGTDSEYVKLVLMGLMGSCAEYTRLSAELGEINRYESATRPSMEPLPRELLARKEKIIQRLPVLKNEQRALDSSLAEYTRNLRTWQTSQAGPPAPEDTAPRSWATCGEIWSYVRAASLREAERTLAERTAGSPADGIPWDKVRMEIDEAFSSGNGAKTSEIVAAYILKNTVLAGTHTSMVGQLVTHNPMEVGKYNVIFGPLAQAEAEGEILSVQFFAGSIPYLQGLLLFLLAAGFPFFALFLLWPSKLTSFAVWLSLWAWVKSWDVGFAMIHVIREILYEVLKWSTVPPETVVDWNDPAIIFRFMYSNSDPLANMRTYYVIISLLTISVPVVTAHLFIGASGLLDAFRSAYDDFPRRFQSFHAASMRRVYATQLEMTIRFQRAWEGYLRALKVAESGGGTTSFKKNGEAISFQRWMAGGGLLARYMGVEAQKGWVEWNYSPQAMQLKGALAMFARRNVAMGHSTEVSQPMVAGLLNVFNEQYEAQAVYDAHGMYLGGKVQEAFGLGGKTIDNSGNASPGYRALPTGTNLGDVGDVEG